MEKKWLLRQENKIQGPFSKEDIYSLILSGQVNEVDEVTPPCDRWFYLRDRSEFMGALEAYKRENSGGSESTETLTSTMNQEEAQFERTRELTSIRPITRTDAYVPKGAYNVRGQELELGEAKKSKSHFPKLLILVSVLLVGAFLFYFKGSDVLSSPKTYKFSTLWQAGDSVAAYAKLKENTDLRLENPIQYAFLTLVQKRNSDQARSFLQSHLLEQERSTPAYKLFEGLAFIYQKESLKAEALFKDLLQKESSPQALMNLGLIQRKKGDFDLAQSYFESVLAKDNERLSSEAAFYLAESWAQRIIKSKVTEEEKRASLAELELFIQNQLNSLSTYKYELSFLLLWLEKNKDAEESAFEAEYLYVEDPEVIFARYKSPEVYRPEAAVFSYLCEGLEKSSFLDYLCGVLVYQNQLDQLRVNENIVKSSKETSVFDILSFIYSKKGLDSKANELLVRSLEALENRRPIKHYMQARFCFKNGNSKCAAENWLKALDINSQAYSAHTGLGLSYFSIGDYKRSEKYAKRASDFTRSFTPLFLLQWDLKKELEEKE